MSGRVEDWRGHAYREHAPLYDGDAVRWCDEPGCERQAVRLCCTAEGDAGRTHWHGGIHPTDDVAGMFYCLDHGRRHGGT